MNKQHHRGLPIKRYWKQKKQMRNQGIKWKLKLNIQHGYKSSIWSQDSVFQSLLAVKISPSISPRLSPKRSPLPISRGKYWVLTLELWPYSTLYSGERPRSAPFLQGGRPTQVMNVSIGQKQAAGLGQKQPWSHLHKDESMSQEN